MNEEKVPSTPTWLKPFFMVMGGCVAILFLGVCILLVFLLIFGWQIVYWL